MEKKNGGLFPETDLYPEFFDHNLIDDRRVIKVFKGPDACLRAFYYQVFKLAFELEYRVSGDDEDQASLDYSASLLNLLSSQTLSLPVNAKDIEEVQLFIQDMQAQGTPDFESNINNNPEIDRSMIAILQCMAGPEPWQIIGEEKRAIHKLRALSDIFQINSEIFFDRCVKFEQSDVFLYVESMSEIYVAYMDFGNQSDSDSEEEFEEEPEKDGFPKKNIEDKVMQKKVRIDPSFQKDHYNEDNNQSNDISLDNAAFKGKDQKQLDRARQDKQNNDTLINIVGDMLMSSKGDSKISNSFVTNLNNSANLLAQATPVRKGRDYSPSQDYPKIEERVSDEEANPNKRESLKSGEGDESHVQAFKYSKSNNFSKSDGVEEPYKYNKSDHLSKTENRQEDLFYHPKTRYPEGSQLHTISEVTASKESILQSKYRRKDPLDYDNEEEKGTFYRQFTNTRILSILPEPHRTKVKMLKNRFVGVHGAPRSNIRHY